LVARLGFVDHVSPEDGFRTCLATGQRWANRAAPGIYFWLAEDGEAYVGQSVKPQTRLRDHWRAHRDLTHAAFRPCPLGQLDALEAELIGKAQQHFALRNIKMAVSTAREVPFDRLVSASECEAFLAGASLADQDWRNYELLTRLQARKHERFTRTEQGRQALVSLRTFLDKVLPKPAATEVGFWSVTLLPDKQFLRLNAGQQEIFTIDIGRGEARLFSAERLSWFRSLPTPYSLPSYETCIGIADLDRWLGEKAVIPYRQLAVRLMRHTTALNSGSHCPQAVRC
jgi:hypothetical protein